jgi:hypothetical protein
MKSLAAMADKCNAKFRDLPTLKEAATTQAASGIRSIEFFL